MDERQAQPAATRTANEGVREAKKATQMTAGYTGSGRTFDDAIGEFAVEYADQNMADYRTFLRAIRDKRIEAVVEDAA